ncbi:MAG: hypothetical protein C5B50_02070 [Verrucomicrobia bacterium]|nr:MAG: hypothetical protein C5B50_02070 [Verrucomicrobiota bacterium]
MKTTQATLSKFNLFRAIGARTALSARASATNSTPRGQGRPRSNRASSLIIVLVMCGILSLSVMGYLSLTEQQNRLSARSQTWNMAIAVVEAGLEEALQQLNSNTANLSADGWSWNGYAYSRTNSFPDGSGYTVTIDFSVDPFHPTVISRAHVSPPPMAMANQPPVFFAAAGVNAPNTSTVSRAVRLRCARGNLLIKGMVAKHLIDLDGNNILTDSFDSSDPAKSVAGRYNAAFYVGDNGDVASNDTIANSIGTGNANIYGHVTTGPNGTVTVGSQGGVGPHCCQVAGHITQGWSANTANFEFPDQLMPYTTAQLPQQGTMSVTNYALSTNNISSTTNYPNPVPYGGVITQTTYVTKNTWPNAPGTSTNCSSTVYTAATKPAAGTYCGTPWQTGNGANNSSAWHWYGIASYTYPALTYTYNLYSTNYTVTTVTNWDNILVSGDYIMSGGVLSGKTLVTGNCRLVVPNGISMSGNDVLQIAQTGSLQIYVGGSSSSVGGNGIINQNGFAINCEIFCIPSVTSFSFNGNGEYIGVLVAPEAHVTMHGGGHSNNDFIGALLADSITMDGHYSFHYDEALGKNPANSRYVVTTWDEIDPNAN